MKFTRKKWYNRRLVINEQRSCKMNQKKVAQNNLKNSSKKLVLNRIMESGTWKKRQPSK